MAKQEGGFYNTSQGVRARFRNVGNDKYPGYWYLFDAIGGFIIGLIFVLVYDTSEAIETRVGWFFIAFVLGSLFIFALSYGVVRARNGGTKKRD